MEVTLYDVFKHHAALAANYRNMIFMQKLAIEDYDSLIRDTEHTDEDLESFEILKANLDMTTDWLVRQSIFNESICDSIYDELKSRERQTAESVAREALDELVAKYITLSKETKRGEDKEEPERGHSDSGGV